MISLSRTLLIFLLYNVLYLKRFVCKAKVFSQNEMAFNIYTKAIYPLYFLPFGFLSTIYQVYRRIEIIKNSKKQKLFIPVEENCKLLIEVIEPTAGICQKNDSFFIKIGQFAISIIRKKLFLNIFVFIHLHTKHFMRVFKKIIHFKENTKKYSNKNTMESISNNLMNLNRNLKPSDGFKYNVLLIHGLNGSSNSTYIKGMANIFLVKNCRVFCFNARGSGGLEPTTNLFSHVGLFSDVKIVIKHILDNYPEDLCIIGFSMGSNWLATSMGDETFEEHNSKRIKLCVGICCPFDFIKLRETMCTTIYRRIMQYFLTANYKRYIKRSTVDKITFKGCRLITDVDKRLMELIKIDFSDEFYRTSSCRTHLQNIKVPFLFLNTSDDPVIPEEVIPVEECLKNPNITLIIIKGGHLGFFTNGQMTMAEIISERFFSIITGEN